MFVSLGPHKDLHVRNLITVFRDVMYVWCSYWLFQKGIFTHILRSEPVGCSVMLVNCYHITMRHISKACTDYSKLQNKSKRLLFFKRFKTIYSTNKTYNLILHNSTEHKSLLIS